MVELEGLEKIESKVRFTREKLHRICRKRDGVLIQDMEKALKTKEEATPILVVLTNNNKEISNLYLAGNSIHVTFEEVELSYAVLVLIMAYYVFELAYPREFCQLLGFIQQLILGDVYNGNKSSGFLNALSAETRSTT